MPVELHQLRSLPLLGLILVGIPINGLVIPILSVATLLLPAAVAFPLLPSVPPGLTIVMILTLPILLWTPPLAPFLLGLPLALTMVWY